MKTFLRLLSFLRPFSGWVLLSIVLGCAAIAAGIGLLGTSASLIARAALHPSIGSLQVAIVGVRFFGLSRGVFRYLERLVSHSVNFRLLAGLRTWFYRSIEPIAPTNLMDLRSGDLLVRAIGDIDTLEYFYVRVASPPITAGIITLGVGLFVGNLNISVGLALVGGLWIGGLVIPVLEYLFVRTAGRNMIEARARVSAILVEGLQGISELTAFSWGGYFLDRVKRANQNLISAQRRSSLTLAAVNALSLLVTLITLAVVLWLAIPVVVSGQMQGYLLAVLAMVALASFEAVSPLPQAAQQLESCLQSGRRIFELANRRKLIAPAELADEPVQLSGSINLAVDNLSYCYPGSETKALTGINFSLPAGKRLAVVGPSGAGKSTLVNLLLRFLYDENGSIQVNKQRYSGIAEDDCRKLFAVISQSTYLFSASVRQNLCMAKPDAADEELADVITKARLTDWLDRLPEGLDTWIGEHGQLMSGGERQRLALARTLLRNAPILLLDEPTAHLDALLEEQILGDLLETNRENSLILATHRLVCMDKMDEILVLDKGEVIERGVYAELAARAGLFSRMLAAQRSVLPDY